MPIIAHVHALAYTYLLADATHSSHAEKQTNCIMRNAITS